jgi:NTE family protein
MRRVNFPAWFLCYFFCALALAGCAGQRPSPAPPEPPAEVMGPPIPETKVDEQELPKDVYGPAVPAPGATEVAAGAVNTTTASATETATATATSTATASGDPGRLCVVLGPGMAKAMAESAVLESLRKAKIPVHCVVGTEMGAIVGALYAASNGSTNNLNWQLFKLNKDNYFAFPMLSLREPRSTGHQLNEFFRGVFRDEQIDRMPIKFGTTAVDDDGDNTVEFDHGPVSDALSASVAVAGIFDPWKIGGHSYRSSASAEPAPMELARRLGGNFLVLVDVLVEGGAPAKSRYHRAFTASRSVLKLVKKDASFTIQVNTGEIAFDDFGRRAEILAAGTDAAEKALPALKAAWEKWASGQR